MPTTALVIDDDPLIRTLIRDTLKAAGFAVLEAPDGPRGLAQAIALKPDVILLDVIMPGLDGYAICERLKADARTQTIPVIFVTVSPDRTLHKRAYAVGAIACIPKPFRPEALVTMTRTALGHRPPQPEKG
jgi:CheY-like chemotaxis protein